MADGSVHIRFRQQQRGVPVRGATWTAHFEAAGRLTSTDGNHVVNAYLVATKRKMTAERVVAAARKTMSGRSPSLPATALGVDQPVLELYPLPAADPVLAWEVRIGTRLDASTRLVSVTLHVEDASARVVGEENNMISSFGMDAGHKAPAAYDRVSSARW